MCCHPIFNPILTPHKYIVGVLILSYSIYLIYSLFFVCIMSAYILICAKKFIVCVWRQINDYLLFLLNKESSAPAPANKKSLPRHRKSGFRNAGAIKYPVSGWHHLNIRKRSFQKNGCLEQCCGAATFLDSDSGSRH